MAIATATYIQLNENGLHRLRLIHGIIVLTCDSLLVAWTKWSNNHHFDVFIFHLANVVTTGRSIFDVFLGNADEESALKSHPNNQKRIREENRFRWTRALPGNWANKRKKCESSILLALNPHSRNWKSKILIVSRSYFKTANIKTMSHLGHDTTHHRSRAGERSGRATRNHCIAIKNEYLYI